jgi:hypothetical protein
MNCDRALQFAGMRPVNCNKFRGVNSNCDKALVLAGV